MRVWRFRRTMMFFGSMKQRRELSPSLAGLGAWGSGLGWPSRDLVVKG